MTVSTSHRSSLRNMERKIKAYQDRRKPILLRLRTAKIGRSSNGLLPTLLLVEFLSLITLEMIRQRRRNRKLRMRMASQTLIRLERALRRSSRWLLMKMQRLSRMKRTLRGLLKRRSKRPNSRKQMKSQKRSLASASTQSKITSADQRKVI